MDVSAVLKNAYKAVLDSGVPDDLRETAFREAVRLQAASQDPQGATGSKDAPTAATPGRQGSAHTSDPPPADAPDEAQFFSKFAQEASTSEEDLRDLYRLEDGRVVLNVQRRKLGTTEAEMNRKAAVLYAAARWYAMGQQTTALSEMREAVSTLGYDVSRNFSKHMDAAGIYTVGQNNNKAVKVRTREIDGAFAKLVDELTQ